MMTTYDMGVKRRREMAARSVRKFKGMIPQLRSYARLETGNPNLKLEAGRNSMTDGKTITICPPLELGLDLRHNGLCDDREFGISLCPACASREHVVGVLRHEIGHIIHGSFDSWDYSKCLNAVLKCGGNQPGQYSLANHFALKIKASMDSKGTDPLIAHVNAAGHPWLSMLMLVMEDARCDEARLRFDPTEQAIFRAISDDLMVNGIVKEDGKITHYIDLELDMQAALAFLFVANETDIDGFFDPDVVELVTSNKKLLDLQDRALNSPNTTESFIIALETLTVFNENEYMIVDPSDDEALEELIKAIEEILKAVLGHGTGVSPDKGGAGGRASDEEEDDGKGLKPADIQNALEALKHLDVAPVNVAAPVVHTGDLTGTRAYGHAYYVKDKADFKSDERHLSPAVTAARLAFGVNSRAEHHRNQKSGRIAGKMLARRVPFGDERLFARKVVPDKRNYHVVIGMDISGSTSGGTLEVEKMAVLAMADVCNRLGISFEIWAHCTEYSGDDDDDAPSLYEIKGTKQPWSPATQDRLRLLNSTGANLDGHTLQFYRKRAEAVQATDRIVMYYTDGAMPATNYDEELQVLQSEIKYCNKNNITLMAVGMGVDTPKEHGFDTFQVDDAGDYRKVVEHLGKRLQ